MSAIVGKREEGKRAGATAAGRDGASSALDIFPFSFYISLEHVTIPRLHPSLPFDEKSSFSLSHLSPLCVQVDRVRRGFPPFFFSLLFSYSF